MYIANIYKYQFTKGHCWLLIQYLLLLLTPKKSGCKKWSRKQAKRYLFQPAGTLHGWAELAISLAQKWTGALL